MLYVLAFLAGGVVVGVVANRRPQWFSKAVTLANAVDAQVNKGAAAVVDKLKQ